MKSLYSYPEAPSKPPILIYGAHSHDMAPGAICNRTSTRLAFGAAPVLQGTYWRWYCADVYCPPNRKVGALIGCKPLIVAEWSSSTQKVLKTVAGGVMTAAIACVSGRRGRGAAHTSTDCCCCCCLDSRTVEANKGTNGQNAGGKLGVESHKK